MTKRIVFIGAGAVGSYLGGWLSHTGHDVTLVDPWSEHVEAIRAKGLSVNGPHEPFLAHPRTVHLHESQRLALEEPFDIGFVAVKSYDTPWAASFLKRFVKPEGYIVSSQNCWTDPMVAAAVGQERAVGLIMSSISVALWEPAKVERPGKTRRRDEGHDVFRAGEHDGRITPRIKQLVEMLDPIDAGRVTDNLWGERWSKLCQNSMGNPVSGLADMGMSDIASDRRGRELQIRLASESARVGLALGYKIPAFGGAKAEQWAAVDRGDVYEEMDAMIASKAGGSNWRPSMGQDVVKGRPTEIDYMNGHILARSFDVGIAAPVTAATVDTVREIDAGKLKAAPANIERVLTAAGY